MTLAWCAQWAGRVIQVDTGDSSAQWGSTGVQAAWFPTVQPISAPTVTSPDCQPSVLCPSYLPLKLGNISSWFRFRRARKTISLLPVSQFYEWGEVWDQTISVFTFWVFMAGWLFYRWDSAPSDWLKRDSSILLLAKKEWSSDVWGGKTLSHPYSVYVFNPARLWGMTKCHQPCVCLMWGSLCSEACIIVWWGRGNDRPGCHHDTVITPWHAARVARY